MHFWHWLAFLMVWFVLGPLFVMIFSTVGLRYYSGGITERLGAPDDLILRSGQTRSPLSDHGRPMVPAFRGGHEVPFGVQPLSGLEPTWWTQRQTREAEHLKRAVGGN